MSSHDSQNTMIHSRQDNSTDNNAANILEGASSPDYTAGSAQSCRFEDAPCSPVNTVDRTSKPIESGIQRSVAGGLSYEAHDLSMTGVGGQSGFKSSSDTATNLCPSDDPRSLGPLPYGDVTIPDDQSDWKSESNIYYEDLRTLYCTGYLVKSDN
jgi:hypothetical protein